MSAIVVAEAKQQKTQLTICSMNQMNQARSSFRPVHLPRACGGAFGSGTKARMVYAIPYEMTAEATSDPTTNSVEKLNDPGGGLITLAILSYIV